MWWESGGEIWKSFFCFSLAVRPPHFRLLSPQSQGWHYPVRKLEITQKNKMRHPRGFPLFLLACWALTATAIPLPATFAAVDVLKSTEKSDGAGAGKGSFLQAARRFFRSISSSGHTKLHARRAVRAPPRNLPDHVGRASLTWPLIAFFRNSSPIIRRG